MFSVNLNFEPVTLKT